MRRRGSQARHDELEERVKRIMEEKGYKVSTGMTYHYFYAQNKELLRHDREIDVVATKGDYGLYFECKSGRPSRDKAIGQLYHASEFFKGLFGKRQFYFHAYYDNDDNVVIDWIKNLGGKR